MIDPTSSLLNRHSNTRSLEFIRRALKTYLSFLKKAETSRKLTANEPINFVDECQYVEQLIHDITFVLDNRRYE
jgi:hypothetical protein